MLAFLLLFSQKCWVLRFRVAGRAALSTSAAPVRPVLEGPVLGLPGRLSLGVQNGVGKATGSAWPGAWRTAALRVSASYHRCYRHSCSHDSHVV